MSQGVDLTRLNRLRAKAETVAMALIKNNLQSTDPSLSVLCQRLVRFKPMLAKATSDAQVSDMLKSGLRSVKFVPNAAALDDVEVTRMLSALVDKLGGMAGMLSALT